MKEQETEQKMKNLNKLPSNYVNMITFECSFVKFCFLWAALKVFNLNKQKNQAPEIHVVHLRDVITAP